MHVKASDNNKQYNVMFFEINAWCIIEGIFQLNVTQTNYDVYVCMNITIYSHLQLICLLCSLD